MLLILVMTAYIPEAVSHSRNEWKRNKNAIVYIQWRYTFFYIRLELDRYVWLPPRKCITEMESVA